MPYGELRFNEDDDYFESECEYCGHVGGHDTECVMNEDSFDITEDYYS